jgi:hypothetical protein
VTSRHKRNPLLIRDWTSLWREELVELRQGHDVLGSGEIDEVATDGSAVWIHLDGWGRKLVHEGDGVYIYRVDPRILQDRIAAELNQPPMLTDDRTNRK